MEFTFGVAYGIKIDPDMADLLELELGLDDVDERLNDYLERYVTTIKGRWVIDFDYYGTYYRRGYIVYLDNTFVSGQLGVREVDVDPLDGREDMWDECLQQVIDHLQLRNVHPSWLAWGYAK